MKNLKGCYSKNTDDWKTPKKIYEEYIKNGYIDCFKYQSEIDEFKQEYRNQKLFVNPPYSKLKQVTEWIWHQFVDNHNTIALLIPARTDTKYFHDLIKLQPEIIFIKGRLHFNESKTGAPFPSIIMNFSEVKLPMYRSSEK